MEMASWGVHCTLTGDQEAVRLWNGTGHCAACGATDHEVVCNDWRLDGGPPCLDCGGPTMCGMPHGGEPNHDHTVAAKQCTAAKLEEGWWAVNEAAVRASNEAVFQQWEGEKRA